MTSKYGALSEDSVTVIATEAGDTLKSLKSSSSETPASVMSLSIRGISKKMVFIVTLFQRAINCVDLITALMT